MKKRAVPLAALFVAVSVFYWKVLFGDVTIQWDAVGYFYPYQRHFSDAIRAGRLPFWTDTIFSGFPFLADLQVGAWYPLNWPFFLAGIVPRSIFWELWLHALLAAAGAYLLCEYLTGSRRAGLLAGLFYALSGFFAAHSEHVTLFQAAAYFPLLVVLLLKALDGEGVRWAAAGVIASGCLCLTGHFQVTMYVFVALGIVALYKVFQSRQVLRPAAVLAAMMLGAVLFAAVQLFPTAELVGQSLRARLAATDWSLGIVQAASLATFVYPNALGAFHPERYQGSPDITQHYFYSGLLLVPLAVIGFVIERRVRFLILLIVPAVIYAMGPSGLLYLLLIRLPGFSSVRAPSHAMFIATLGLCVAAGAGGCWIARFTRRAWVYPVLFAIVLSDVWIWNMQRNPLVYKQGSFEQAYGPAERWFQDLTKLPLPRFQRLAAPGRSYTFYPADAPFGFPVETTFGTNPLMLSRYYDYLTAMNDNPALMAGLGVGLYFDRTDYVTHTPAVILPRFQFPRQVRWETSPQTALPVLDPVETGVMAGKGETSANSPGQAEVIEAEAGYYRLQVTAPSPAVMRISIPYFPGWHAEVDGRPQELLVIDHALMGLRLPAGTHSVRLWFRSTYFIAGAAISILTAVACFVLLFKRTSWSHVSFR